MQKSCVLTKIKKTDPFLSIWNETKASSEHNRSEDAFLYQIKSY